MTARRRIHGPMLLGEAFTRAPVLALQTYKHLLLLLQIVSPDDAIGGACANIEIENTIKRVARRPPARVLLPGPRTGRHRPPATYPSLPRLRVRCESKRARCRKGVGWPFCVAVTDRSASRVPRRRRPRTRRCRRRSLLSGRISVQVKWSPTHLV